MNNIFKRMDRCQFEESMKKIKDRNEQAKMRMELKEEKNKYKRKKVETSKLLAIYLFFVMNSIILYAMFAMWRFGDLTYLGVLVSDIAAQVVVYAIYCMKAYHAKKQSELIKLDREVIEKSHQNDEDAVG